MNRLRLFFALIMLAGAATMFVSASSYAAKDDPHQEETDGCDHGATGKECKEDPSEKGKDCEKHGRHGGINEDHCTSTTTTTARQGSTTTTTSGGVTTTTLPARTTTTLPGTGTVVPDFTGPASTPTPAGPGGVAEVPRTTAPPADDLATTGASSMALVAVAGGLLLFGAGLRKVTRQP